MKTIRAIPFLIAAILPASAADNPPGPRMRDAATHEQLVMTYRQASNEDPMRHMPPAKGSDPSIVNLPKDLVADSDILCFGGSATLVPKRAILNMPKNLADRLKFQPGSKIQSWSDFFALNRGWITTVEVSRIQAEGNKPLEVEISDRVRKSANLVVATYQGGPISVLPPKVPQETATTK
jgi:hypothetical protein